MPRACLISAGMLACVMVAGWPMSDSTPPRLSARLKSFVRVNSWDVVTNPHFLFGIARLRLEDPLGNPELIAVSLLFTAFLTVTYLVVYNLTALDLHERSTRR